MKVIVTGGGTGGHIYPALALVKELKKHEPNAEFLYIGSDKGLEKEIIKKENLPFLSIDISGFKRKITFENMKTVLRFIKSVHRSKKIIDQFKPDVVIGTGGFVCGPVLYAASRKKIPSVIHEQNVIPGLTNLFLSRFVDVVAISFEGSRKYFKRAKQIVLTGNPRATEVYQADKKAAYQALQIPLDKKIILMFGGSRGAEAINRTFLEMIPYLTEYPEYHFVFVTGNAHYDAIEKQLEAYDQPLLKNVSLYPYLHNMPAVLAATDINISRAGATTLAEVTALGIPSILIPSPYVTNNHQELNARWMEEQGAAKMIKEKELSGSKLLSMIEKMAKERKLYSERAKKIGHPEAAKALVDVMKKLENKLV